MREILFRGKTEKGEWVYGNYCGAEYLTGKGIEHFIIEVSKSGRSAKIIPETVGQYTGLTDKNGKKIFEGDIVKVENVQIGVVEFGKGTFDSGIYCYYGWHIKDIDGFIDHNELYLYDENNIFEVIGNIHDNPELLGG